MRPPSQLPCASRTQSTSDFANPTFGSAHHPIEVGEESQVIPDQLHEPVHSSKDHPWCPHPAFTQPTIIDEQVTSNAPPQNAGSNHQDSQPQKKMKKKGPASSLAEADKPTPLTTLLCLYAKNLEESTAYQKKQIESKERWKMAELDEKREARAQTKAAHKTAEQALVKKARIERKHQLQLAQMEKKMQVLSDLARAGISRDEAAQWLDLLKDDV